VEFDAEVVDADQDCKGVLYRFKLDDLPFCFLGLEDFSTGKKYFLGVPNDLKSVREALAWTFKLEEGFDYKPALQT